MDIISKIKPYLKKIIIGITAFISVILLSKLYTLLKSKDNAALEDVKKSIDNAKSSVSEVNKISESSKETLEEMHDIIKESIVSKEDVVNTVSDSLKTKAVNAGFKKKEITDTVGANKSERP